MTTISAQPRDAASGTHTPRHQRSRRTVARWLATFLGFPIGGYTAILVVGPLESTAAALAGGAVTGAVLGLTQAWALKASRARTLGWVLATAVGLAVGAALGAAAIDYATDIASLVVLGAITGASVGLAQGAVLLRRLGAAALLWPLVLAGAWGLGWPVSEAVIGTSVDQHFYVFGASGALVVAALTAPLPLLLDRRSRDAASAPTS